jgi:hypothetical protein
VKHLDLEIVFKVLKKTVQTYCKTTDSSTKRISNMKTK